VDEQTKYLSTRKAAEQLNVSLRTVQLWVERGSLKAWKTAGGHRRILQESVNQFIKNRELTIKENGGAREIVMVMVDDDSEILEAYSSAISLTGLPIKLFTASNGYEGLLKIGKYRPDIIMTDLMMPTMDGYGMLNAISSDIDVSESEIIIVTALDKNIVTAIDNNNGNLKGLITKKITLFQKPLNFESLEKILRSKVEEMIYD
jgi:excisionase family DNA binding protein